MDSINEQDRFDTLVLSQIGAIQRIGRRRLRREDALDDFTQEVLLRVYANREQLRDIARLPNWVSAIACHTAHHWWRKEIPELPEMFDELPHPAPNADERMEETERWRMVLEAVNTLEATDRDLLRSYYLEETSYEELQLRHGLSYNAVGFRLHRARQRVKRRCEAAFGALALALATPARRILAASLAVSAIGGSVWIQQSVGNSPEPMEARAPYMTPKLPEYEERVKPPIGFSSLKTHAAKIETAQPEWVRWTQNTLFHGRVTLWLVPGKKYRILEARTDETVRRDGLIQRVSEFMADGSDPAAHETKMRRVRDESGKVRPDSDLGVEIEQTIWLRLPGQVEPPDSEAIPIDLRDSDFAKKMAHPNWKMDFSRDVSDLP